ncbi:hypothetical protein SLEP1_g893 [Rubroshorea leprosula]|uniref:Transmembrane protein n=1 Tax=Rubroshorea leprosula TaxID=152421 RepID=A0AAV5HKS0_9ROSI|nr:hypothetical protein SLEP1_g893 [Rubroshorea leprosula]
MIVNKSPPSTCHQRTPFHITINMQLPRPLANGIPVYPPHRKIGPPTKPAFIQFPDMQKDKLRRTRPISLVFIIVVPAAAVLLLLRPWNWKLNPCNVPSMTSSFSSDHDTQPTLLKILLASSLALIIVAAVHYHLRKLRDHKIIPRLRSLNKGRGQIDEKIERFPHYVGKLFDLIPVHI